jgi:hypothetical protein
MQGGGIRRASGVLRRAFGTAKDWFCFGRVCQVVHFRKSLISLSLCSFFALRKLGSFAIFWLATKHFFATEANFSLHRIKNQVGWGGRVFDIEFSNGGPS